MSSHVVCSIGNIFRIPHHHIPCVWECGLDLKETFAYSDLYWTGHWLWNVYFFCKRYPKGLLGGGGISLGFEPQAATCSSTRLVWDARTVYHGCVHSLPPPYLYPPLKIYTFPCSFFTPPPKLAGKSIFSPIWICCFGPDQKEITRAHSLPPLHLSVLILYPPPYIGMKIQFLAVLRGVKNGHNHGMWGGGGSDSGWDLTLRPATVFRPNICKIERPQEHILKEGK